MPFNRGKQETLRVTIIPASLAFKLKAQHTTTKVKDELVE